MAQAMDNLPASYIHANHTDRILAANISLLVIPLVFVSLRIISRRLSQAGFWFDDYFGIAAMLLAWCLPILNLIGTIDYGNGRHILTLAPDTRSHWFKNLYVFEIFYTVAVTCVKFSTLAFYRRIFPIEQLQRVILGACIVVFALATACLFTIIFQCHPIHRFWDFSPGYCIDVDKFFLSSGSLNCILDFAIVLMPVPLLWRLSTTTSQKVILTGIFSTAGFVCIVSIVRLVVLSRLDVEDVTWNYINAAIWTATEPAMGVVSACLPSLRPLYSLLVKGSYHGPARKSTPGNTSKTSASMWRSMTSNNDDKDLRSFTRLEDGEGHRRWGTNSTVLGGRQKPLHGEPEEIIEDLPLPERGIRVKTEVTLISSSALSYYDQLY